MNHQILFISKNEDHFLARTRCDILERAGYLTLQADGLNDALSLAQVRRADLIIIEHSFSLLEQKAFVNSVHESRPDLHVLCLQYGLIPPGVLLKECESIFSGQPRGGRIRAI